MTQVSSSTHAGDVAPLHSPLHSPLSSSAHQDAEPSGSHRPGAARLLRQLQHNRQLVRSAMRAMRAEVSAGLTGAGRSIAASAASSPEGGSPGAGADVRGLTGMAGGVGGRFPELGAGLSDRRTDEWAGWLPPALREGQAWQGGRAEEPTIGIGLPPGYGPITLPADEGNAESPDSLRFDFGVDAVPRWVIEVDTQAPAPGDIAFDSGVFCERDGGLHDDVRAAFLGHLFEAGRDGIGEAFESPLAQALRAAQAARAPLQQGSDAAQGAGADPRAMHQAFRAVLERAQAGLLQSRSGDAGDAGDPDPVHQAEVHRLRSQVEQALQLARSVEAGDAGQLTSVLPERQMRFLAFSRAALAWLDGDGSDAETAQLALAMRAALQDVAWASPGDAGGEAAWPGAYGELAAMLEQARQGVIDPVMQAVPAAAPEAPAASRPQAVGSAWHEQRIILAERVRVRFERIWRVSRRIRTRDSGLPPAAWMNRATRLGSSTCARSRTAGC